jgi:transcriptional regulator with XRE-family HTH domain
MEKQPFGETLREIREKSGISMRGLAEAVDMDPAYLSRLENSKRGIPKSETVEKLAQGLCDQQNLDTRQCDHLKRQLLVEAGHLQDQEELIDDLSERFADRLRTEGLPEANIDETLTKVSLATMRAVLLGKENLEIDMLWNYSPGQIAARKEAGEEVHTLHKSIHSDLLSSRINSDTPLSGASEYLDRHASEFATHRLKHRTMSKSGRPRMIQAGRDAQINISKSMTKDQEKQLRLIAKLIENLLEEK